MTANSKGAAIEKQAQEILEKWGYRVQRASRKMTCIGPGRYISQDNDFWNCVDLLAIKSDSPVRMVQTTDPTSVSHHRQKFISIPFPFAHCWVEIWAWHAGKRSKGDAGKYLLAQVFSVTRLQPDGSWLFCGYVLADGRTAKDLEQYEERCREGKAE